MAPTIHYGPPVESFAHKLWRGKWILLWTSVAFTLIALMLGALQTPRYKEQTSIEIRSPDNSTLPLKAGPPDVPYPFESYLQTQIRIIESRSLVERVLARLPDAERTRLLASPRFWWNHKTYEQTLEAVRRHVSAKPSDQAGIVDIVFLSPDAQGGAHFLNVLTQELADLNVERAWHAMQHNRQWAERQIDDLRRKWEQSEQVLAEYKQASGVSDGQAAVAVLKKPALSRAPVQGASFRKANDRKANDAKLRQLKSKLDQQTNQLAQWEALYGSFSPTTQNMRNQLAATQEAIRQTRAAVHPVADADPLNYAVVSTPAEQARPAAPASPTAAHLRALQQDAESSRLAYETIATRLKEASSIASQLGDISVVDPAIAAATATTPNQFLTGAVGALTGLLAAIGFVVIRDRFSNTFGEPGILGHYLGLPVLGAIPSDRLGPQESAYNPVTQEPAVHLNFENNVRTAEAFRSIRSSILLGLDDKPGARRLVFTSATASEGKTFVLVNLGAALASAQRRVLLVDGNLRHPSLHKIFGAENNRGLADLLSRQISEHPFHSRDVIRETQIPDLYLLSAGQAGIKAPEVLSSAQLPQLIREFAKGFDFVLLDSPPILPYSDARSLARSADAVVLVVKACATSRQEALQARDAIWQDGATILGSILTEWDGGNGASAAAAAY